jgi:hypothetical protein
MPDQEALSVFCVTSYTMGRTGWSSYQCCSQYSLNESNLGLGVTIINDKIGPTTENTISTDVSYTVPTENFKLFGIKATANF